MQISADEKKISWFERIHMESPARHILKGLMVLMLSLATGCSASNTKTKEISMRNEKAVNWLLGSIEKKNTAISDKLRNDPKEYLKKDTSAQAALSRQIWDMDPLSSDEKVLETLAKELTAHLKDKKEPSNDAFQKGYAELMLREYPVLQKATVSLIEEQWNSKRKIGHYELFSALVMEYPKEEQLRKTFTEIRRNLKTWNNKGWCPWTPALWMRILWLGENMADSSKDITKQLEYIDSNMDKNGKFQFREPFCLMYSIGLMNHPIGDKMLDRFLRVIIDKQEPNGGWGEFSYIVFTVLKKWDLLDTLTP